LPFQLLRQKMNYSIVPWCTYTDPESRSGVGLNGAEAKQQNISYNLTSVGVNELGRAVIEGEELGFIKVLTAKGTDKILDVTIVAAHARDLLHDFVLATLVESRHKVSAPSPTPGIKQCGIAWLSNGSY
jgi:pyruvate/2-oxoglutarate dehydrogenase complex dihydrolipoamide dehydrogenase (E3) component